MKNKVSFRTHRRFALTAVEILEARVAPAALTWTGQTNNQWTTAGNWSPASQPADGDTLTFDDTSVSSGVLNNNTTPGNSYTLVFNATSHNYTITGNSILLDNVGSDIRQLGTSAVAIDVSLSLLQAPDGGNPSVVNVTAGSELLINGAMTMGAGTFRKQGGGVLTLSGANSFSGTLAVDLGVIKLGANNTLPTTALSLQLFDATSTLDMNGFSQTLSRVAGNGVVDNFSATVATLTLNDATNASSPIQFRDTVGNLNFVKAGAGTLTLTGINGGSNLSGTKTVTGGTLVVNGTFGGPGQMTVNAGATLGGAGNVSSPVTIVAGGNLAPAQGGTGVIGSGNLTLNNSATFTVNVNGNVPATNHDQVSVVGSVSLGNASLVMNGSVPSNPGQQIVLIANDGSDGISGTFNGIAEGGTVTINGVVFTMTYAGGVGGNDVVLVQSAPPAETTLDLVGGDVIVADALGGTSNDDLFISLQSGGVVRFFDPVNTLGAGAGLTQVDANTVEVALASITGEINFNATNGDDHLTVDFTGGSPAPSGGIRFNGGNPAAAPGDQLFIVSSAPGTHAASILHNILNTFDGAVNIDGSLINYSAIESVDDMLVATNRAYVFPNLAETISLQNNFGGGMKIAGPPAGGVAFANPTNSLTINGGGGNDIINIVSLSPTFGGALVINGNTGSESIVFPNTLILPGDLIINTGTGADSISFDAALTIGGNAVFTSGGGIVFSASVSMAADKNLTATALGTSDGTISLATSSADLAASGTGAISLTTARDISLTSGSSIVVQNGAATLSANAAGTNPATFDGIFVDTAVIQSTGSGNVTLVGKGGLGGGADPSGVVLTNNALVLGGTSGTVSVTGTGGSGTSSLIGTSNLMGVTVENSTITSSGGNVEVTGFGGTSSNAQSGGVFVYSNGVISAGGTGTVTVQGTGGVGTGADCGVGLAVGGLITSTNGPVNVIGFGGGGVGAPRNDGVFINLNSVISAGGTNSVTVTGTGGSGSGGEHHGLRMIGSSITSGGGDVFVTATEGTGGTSNRGIFVDGTSTVSTETNGGNVTIATDSIGLAGTLRVNGVSTATVRQKTNGVAINLGAAFDDTPGTLELNPTEFLNISGGTVRVGDLNSGATTVSAPVYCENLVLGPTVGFSPGGALAYLFSGTGGAPVYSPIRIEGSITLANSTLSIANSLTSAATVPITLLQITPGLPIGTFSGLPQGASLTVGNSSFTIDYAGPGGTVRLLPAVLPPVITPGSIKVEDLNGTNGFSLLGETNGDLVGQSVSGAGDINGDGVGDFVIGASGNGGRAYVVFGNPGGFSSTLSLGSLDGTNGFRIERPAGNELLGITVSAAGDVNGDGRADLLVSERQADATGATYVVFGQSSAFAATLNVSTLNGTNGFKLSGSSVRDQGTHVASGAGDVNGDGAADIIIGISTASNSLGQSTGAAYVVFGHLSGVPFTANLDLSALTGANGFKMTGEAAGALFGSAVSTAGDVNGDGRADVLIGARDAVRLGATTGAAYLVFGRNTAFQPSIAASTLNGATGVKIYGLADGNHIGAGVASAGDINADGFSDILIGSSETSLAKAGSSYVIFGKALAFASTFNLATLDGNNGFAIIGETSADRAGESVGSVGDFNGDTFGDIIVGAPGVGAGTSYLVFGRPTGFAPTLQLGSINGTTGFRYQGVGTGDESGSSVNGAGDVNADGKMDLIIGARSAGPGISTSGEAYVVYGSGASLAIPVASPTGATVTYSDVAGNHITITATVGKLTADMLVFDAAGNLSLVDLNASGTFKNGSSLSFTAVRNDTDQPLNVGTISAPGITLLAVTVTGNLNKIDVGGANPLKTAIRSLTVGSLGTVGGAFPAPGEEASLTSNISGRIGKLTVTGDINYATINVSGAVGLLNVGGNFLGTGAFTAAQVLGLAALGHGEVANVGGGITLASSGLTAARIGTINLAGSLSKASVKSASTITSVKVGVDVHKSAVVAAGAIRNVTISGSLTSDDPAEPSVMTALASVANGRPASAVGMGSFTVKGNVLNALVLIGYDSNFVAKNSDAKVGSINVTGTWTASSFAVGIDDITDNGFGRNDRPIFGGTDTTPEIISSIARITIGGIAQGNGDPLAHFGITAQYIGNAKIAGLKIPLVKTAIDEYPLGTNFSLVEVSAS